MISIPLNHYPSINSIKGKQRNEVIIMMPKVKHRFLSFSNLKQFTHEMLTSLFYLNDFLCFESSGRSCQCASDQISNPCPDSDSIPFHLVKHNCEATLWGAKKNRGKSWEHARLSGDVFMQLGCCSRCCYTRVFSEKILNCLYIVIFSTRFMTM